MGIDPVSLAIVGTVVSALGSVVGGIQGMQSANYNAKLASRNAEIAKRQGELEAERLDRDGRRQRGAIAAAYGANNIVGGEGSPLDVLENSFTIAALDQQNARYNADIRAYGYQTEAAAQKQAGKNALTKGLFGAAGTAIGGLSSLPAGPASTVGLTGYNPAFPGYGSPIGKI
jgi:hypothetical protein